MVSWVHGQAAACSCVHNHVGQLWCAASCAALRHVRAVLCLSAAIVPPAVTRERGNPLTLALQSALVPAQVSWTLAGTLMLH